MKKVFFFVIFFTLISISMISADLLVPGFKETQGCVSIKNINEFNQDYYFFYKIVGVTGDEGYTIFNSAYCLPKFYKFNSMEIYYSEKDNLDLNEEETIYYKLEQEGIEEILIKYKKMYNLTQDEISNLKELVKIEPTNTLKISPVKEKAHTFILFNQNSQLLVKEKNTYKIDWSVIGIFLLVFLIEFTVLYLFLKKEFKKLLAFSFITNLITWVGASILGTYLGMISFLGIIILELIIILIEATLIYKILYTPKNMAIKIAVISNFLTGILSLFYFL